MTPDPASLAFQLLEAARSHRAIGIDDFPSLSEEEAYQVQEALVTRMCLDGGRIRAGFKISMTSPETQALANAAGPAYGALTSEMILDSPATVSLKACFEPKLELEIQFRADETLSVGARRAEVESLCSVAPGIEIPDSRFAEWFGNLSVGHIISDNAVGGHLAVGIFRPLSTVPDLRGVRAELLLGQEVVAGGIGSYVMGDPVVAIEWLTHRLARDGRALTKGMVVSSGTLCMPADPRPGTYHARYSDLGEVDLTLV